jgi:hypothetical protein
VCEDLLPQQDLEKHQATSCEGPQASTSAIKAPSLNKSQSRSSDTKRKASIFDIKGKFATTTGATASSPAISNNQYGNSTGDDLTTPKRFKTSTALERAKPLPERVRPKSLNDVVGQSHLLAKGALLRNLIDKDAVGKYLYFFSAAFCR